MTTRTPLKWQAYDLYCPHCNAYRGVITCPHYWRPRVQCENCGFACSVVPITPTLEQSGSGRR